MSNERKGLIAGNWKMNGLADDARRWALAAAKAAEGAPNDVALFPPYPYLSLVLDLVGGPDATIGVGAQACADEPYGAFTGRVSAAMLKDIGCRYVLCGHSERRQGLDETDQAVAAQMLQALEAGLIPVVCVGETFEERKGLQARNVVLRQVDAVLEALPGGEAPLILAYEPIWAIGTGLTASPVEAAEAHGWIRYRVRDRDPKRAEGLRILYGGSAKPGNIGSLLAAADVDGALVGGASLDPEAFAAMITAEPKTDS